MLGVLQQRPDLDRDQDVVGGGYTQEREQRTVSLPKSSIFTDAAINYIFDLHSDLLVLSIFVAARL